MHTNSMKSAVFLQLKQNELNITKVDIIDFYCKYTNITCYNQNL